MIITKLFSVNISRKMSIFFLLNFDKITNYELKSTKSYLNKVVFKYLTQISTKKINQL